MTKFIVSTVKWSLVQNVPPDFKVLCKIFMKIAQILIKKKYSQ